MLWFKSFKDLIHRLLITVHTTTDPQIVIFFINCVFCWEWCHWSYLSELMDIAWKLVFNKYTTLWCSEVGASLLKPLLVKWFMNNPNSWSTSDTNTNQASDVIEMTFCESFSSIKRINPDNGIFDIEFFKERACWSHLWIGSSQLLNVVLAFFMWLV